MTDRRLHPGNGRVVLAGVAARGDEQPVEGRPARALRDVFLHAASDGRRDRQLLFGDRVEIIENETSGGREMSFIRSAKDGYVGWTETSALGADGEVTHWVSVRSTHAYPAPDLKRPPIFALHMTSPVGVTGTEDGWSRIDSGEPAWVPTAHLSPFGDWIDPVRAARAFLGTPYVWAGNSGSGLDCSGLVTAAFRAAGWSVPGDSDLQETMPGAALGETDALEPGDLIFWKGHVAMATGPETMIHATAHHMMVVEEPIGPAIQRIAASSTGPVTSRLRPEPTPLETI